jgi:ATP-binding cassette subfamily B multidrug efflux pump
MHRYLLHQSLGFFQDEFAGRIATRVMQTALAVRTVVLTLLDILVYVAVYFLSVLVLLTTIDPRLALPLLLWLALYLRHSAWCCRACSRVRETGGYARP